MQLCIFSLADLFGVVDHCTKNKELINARYLFVFDSGFHNRHLHVSYIASFQHRCSGIIKFYFVWWIKVKSEIAIVLTWVSGADEQNYTHSDNIEKLSQSRLKLGFF